MIARCRRTLPRERPRRSSSGRRPARACPASTRRSAARSRSAIAGARKHRLVVIGDSLTHGFQSGAIHNTALAYGAIVAHELDWDGFRFPRYGGPGGLPVNIEYLLRDLERRFGDAIDLWELPAALLRARAVMDEIEDYWERGAGSRPPADAEIKHAQAVFGCDLRDALVRNAERSERVIKTPNDDPFDQIVEHYRPRAALHVHPRADDAAKRMTFLDAARALGGGRRDRDARRLPRLQQRARRGHRPQARLERRRLPRPGGQERLHGLAPVALRRRVRRAGGPGGADRCAPRDLGDRPARHDRAAGPRRRLEAGSAVALLPVLHAAVDRRRRFRPARRPAPHRSAGACHRLRDRRLQRHDPGQRGARPRRRPRLVPARDRRHARPAGPPPLHRG